MASFGHKEPGIIGRNTLDGLAFLLALALRFGGERRLAQVAHLSDALGIRPTAEYGVNANGGDAEVDLELAPPPGWRHEPDPSGIGIGVLAPDDAFADEYPVFTGDTDAILADATRLLDAGHPASALLGLTTAYHEDVLRLPDLHAAWTRAYDDLDRPLLRERLDVMLENHREAFGGCAPGQSQQSRHRYDRHPDPGGNLQTARPASPRERARDFPGIDRPIPSNHRTPEQPWHSALVWGSV